MPKIYKSKDKLVVDNLKLSQASQLELEQGGSLLVDVKVLDQRKMTEQQRKFIFSLVGDYANYTGEDKEYTRMLLQQFNANVREIEVESLSTCDMTYANNLIETIISFYIENEIPFRKKDLKDFKYDFTYNQIYAMTLKRLCVVCGKKAHIHHIDVIGAGNDRKTISHIGKRVLPLCPAHHNEIHSIGNDQFMNKYILQPIEVDKKLEHFIKKGTLKSWEAKK